MVMMHEVVVHLDKKQHVLGVGYVGSQMGVGMSNKSLFEGINGDDPVGSVVDRIWGLAKIRAPSLEPELR